MVPDAIEMLKRNKLAPEGCKVVSDLIEIASKEKRNCEEFLETLEKNLLKTRLMRLVVDAVIAVYILKFDVNRKVPIGQATRDYEQKLALSSRSPGDHWPCILSCNVFS
eukprot:jgi/Mesvir1/2441/Mv26023-RA.1